MNHVHAKTAVALLSTVALAATAAANIAPALTSSTAQTTQPDAQQRVDKKMADMLVRAANVQGDFAFDQGVLSSNADISNTFSKASTALCANMPAYLETLEAQPINVGGDVGNGFSATLSEIADDEGTESYELACSCASNPAGGGAIVNANVEGVSLASIADKARAN